MAPSVTVLVNYGYPGYQVYTYYGIMHTSWGNWGNYGYSVMLFIYIFKNLVTFIIETVLNVTSLVLFKRHLAHKAKLLSTKTIKAKPIQANLLETSTSHSAANSAHKHGESESAGGRNMANLVMVMSLSGFVQNMIQLVFTVCTLVNSKPNLGIKALQLTASFASTVRHAMNFAQFFCFNSNFRKETKLVFANIKFFNKS
jgi:hypothetical protein